MWCRQLEKWPKLPVGIERGVECAVGGGAKPPETRNVGPNVYVLSTIPRTKTQLLRQRIDGYRGMFEFNTWLPQFVLPLGKKSDSTECTPYNPPTNALATAGLRRGNPLCPLALPPDGSKTHAQNSSSKKSVYSSCYC